MDNITVPVTISSNADANIVRRQNGPLIEISEVNLFSKDLLKQNFSHKSVVMLPSSINVIKKIK